MIQTFREEIRAGIEQLNVKAKTEEERRTLVEAKRKIVLQLVKSVEVDGRKKAKVTFGLDLRQNCEVSESVGLLHSGCD